MSLSKQIAYFLTFGVVFLSCSTSSIHSTWADDDTETNKDSQESVGSQDSDSTSQPPTPTTQTKAKPETKPESKDSSSTKAASRWHRGIRKLEKRLKKNPDDLKAHFLMAHAYYQLKDLDKAIFHLRKTHIKPSVRTLTFLAKILDEKGDHLEEVRVRGMLLDLIPHSPHAQTDMAKAYQKIKKPEKAIEHYKLAIKAYKKHRPAYQGLWEIFESLKDFYEMRQTLIDFLKLFPNDRQANAKICEVNMNTGFLDEAVEKCRLAIDLNMDDPSNHVHLGLTYKLRGNDKQAKRILLTAARQFQDSEVTQYQAGVLAEGEKNFESALKFYTRCSQVDQTSLRCFLQKALLEVRLNQHAQAGQSFLSACRINKSTANHILNVVGQLRTQNDMEGYQYFKKIKDKCYLEKATPQQLGSQIPKHVL